MGKVRIQIVHFGSIYAQKDSFAHRYGFFEICGSVPLDLGLFGPVARSRRALYLRRAAGGCFGGAWLLRRRWAAGGWSACCWSAGNGLLRLFVSAGTIVFFSPASHGGLGADPGGIVRTLRLQLPALRIYIPRRADSVDRRTQKNFVTKYAGYGEVEFDRILSSEILKKTKVWVLTRQGVAKDVELRRCLRGADCKY